MDLSEALVALYTPRTDGAATGDDSPARRLRDAVEPLATIGYHAPPAMEAYATLGFDFLPGYVWGRTSSLGEPEPTVAASSFGVWQTEMIESVYSRARARVSLEEVRAVRLRGATESLRQVLGDAETVDGLEETVVALETAIASLPLLGRPIFAGLTGHPRPSDLHGRLWHATNCLREHRGDAHLAALVGARVDGVQANLLNELATGLELFSYTATREWTDQQMDDGLQGLERRGLVADGALTDLGAALREALEIVTDAAEQDLVEALGDDLDRHVERLAGWAQQVVERGWFPDDQQKRDAG